LPAFHCADLAYPSETRIDESGAAPKESLFYAALNAGCEWADWNMHAGSGKYRVQGSAAGA